MATKAKKNGRAAKRRLALPAHWVKNIEDARKSFKHVQDIGAKEVEKIYHKVIEIDFVKRVQKNDALKRASKAGAELCTELEGRVEQIGKEVEHTVKNFRKYIPVPTRSEVDALARKINQLSKKVDDMSVRRPSASAN